MALILLLCFILPQMTTAMECPNGVEVNRTCYNRSHLLDLKEDFRHDIIINQLGILQKSRTLYYSYEPELEEPEYHHVGFINLDDHSQFGEISPPDNSPMNFYCFDFDQNNTIIYLGSNDGVKKFDPSNNLLTHVSSEDRMILSISFNDRVYFVRDGENEIIFQEADDFESLLKDDKNRTREEYLPKTLVKKFVIAKDNTVIFLTTKGLFAAEAERNSQVHRLSKHAYFHGLAVDLHGEVYTWWVDGIYKVFLNTLNPAHRMVIRVANIPSIGALMFDTDNSILYTVGKSLFRLVKSE